MAGKRISLDFDGVFENSYVYLNGQLVGNHPYGYTGYSYDITDLVHADGHTPNVLAVVVQNQEPSSRWYSGSGITRHVHLTVANPLHIARWGTTVTTPTWPRRSRRISPPSTWPPSWPTTAARRTPSTCTTWSGTPAGHAVADATTANVAVPAAGATNSADIRLDNPHLWSTTNPYLYTVQTTVTGAGASGQRNGAHWTRHRHLRRPLAGVQPHPGRDAQRPAAQAPRRRPAQR